MAVWEDGRNCKEEPEVKGDTLHLSHFMHAARREERDVLCLS